ncbi:hypothetical protein BO71DRAFT_219352 [Aspergillus ellipticus CBS 707.79]|uniref:Uncharacterized protein n=1 Tax=Aspergillus ellipticus CBS 707.79 TaxID=1448320 RepID=A0A319DBS2_9EURO|nr:hypothetical protein BO71DRAFT_219352 [Aspergillus ellipticus CBS 707.79]
MSEAVAVLTQRCIDLYNRGFELVDGLASKGKVVVKLQFSWQDTKAYKYNRLLFDDKTQAWKLRVISVAVDVLRLRMETGLYRNTYYEKGMLELSCTITPGSNNPYQVYYTLLGELARIKDVLHESGDIKFPYTGGICDEISLRCEKDTDQISPRQIGPSANLEYNLLCPPFEDHLDEDPDMGESLQSLVRKFDSLHLERPVDDVSNIIDQDPFLYFLDQIADPDALGHDQGSNLEPDTDADSDAWVETPSFDPESISGPNNGNGSDTDHDSTASDRNPGFNLEAEWILLPEPYFREYGVAIPGTSLTTSVAFTRRRGRSLF